MTKSLRTGEDKTMKRKILNIIKIVVLLSVFLGTLNISNTTFATDANQTLEDGVYTIKSALNEKFVFDIYSSLKTNDAKVELWTSGGTITKNLPLSILEMDVINITCTFWKIY